jgi:hypothetical protein
MDALEVFLGPKPLVIADDEQMAEEEGRACAAELDQMAK